MQVTNKGEEHHAVLQPFGFMNGNDLDQVALALQVQLLIIGIVVGMADLLGKPARQCRRSLLLQAGGRQQLAQVQQVSQTPLTIRAGQ